MILKEGKSTGSVSLICYKSHALFQTLSEQKLLKSERSPEKCYLQAVPGLKSNALYLGHKALPSVELTPMLPAVTPKTGSISAPSS